MTFIEELARGIKRLPTTTDVAIVTPLPDGAPQIWVSTTGDAYLIRIERLLPDD